MLRSAPALITSLLAGAVLVGAAANSPPSGERSWVTAWATAMQSARAQGLGTSSIRMIARVSVPGRAVRVRLDNGFGTRPLAIGRASVGLRARGAALVAGSNRPLTFNRASTIEIPPGQSIVSDPVDLDVKARQDLAISLYVPDKASPPSQHNTALVTSYLAGNDAGDVTADETADSFSATTTSSYWLSAIDVDSSASSVVVFGDSLSDGVCSTVDGYSRWPDWLSVRMDLESSGSFRRAVINQGISGNTLTREGLQPPVDSPPGLERLDRDVLQLAGVSHVVLFLGSNDIRRGADAAQVIAAMQDVIKRVKMRGLRIIGATIAPRDDVAASGTNTGWDATKTRIRNEVNRWIRSGGAFEAVIDFDRVLADRLNPDVIARPFNCDGIHPTPLGYYEMGKSVRLELFKRR